MAKKAEIEQDIKGRAHGLEADLKQLVKDAEALLSATKDSKDAALSELRARVDSNLRQARTRLSELDDDLRDQARRAAGATEDYVHENPWSSLGMAAAAGLFIGVLLGRR